MPEILNGAASADAYTAGNRVSFQLATNRVALTVLNQPVFVQWEVYRPGYNVKASRDNWSAEARYVPGVHNLGDPGPGPVVGMQFRSASAGNPGDVSVRAT